MTVPCKSRMFVCHHPEDRILEDWLTERFGPSGDRWSMRVVKTWRDDPVVVDLAICNSRDQLAFDLAWYGKLTTVGDWKPI